MTNELREPLKSQIDNLSDVDKDTLYRYLWTKYVKEDITSHAVDLGKTLTEEQLNEAARQWICEGEYDCSLDHWTNIENLINKVLGDD